MEKVDKEEVESEEIMFQTPNLLSRQLGFVSLTSSSRGHASVIRLFTGCCLHLPLRTGSFSPAGVKLKVWSEKWKVTEWRRWSLHVSMVSLLCVSQTQLELDKYLPQGSSSLLSLSTDAGDKKYRRESASVVDEYFSDDKPSAPYSVNINVILPSTNHLRTGLYRSNTKTLTPQQIKTEPGLEVPCSISTSTTQALPDFTSVFSVPPVVNNVFIKPDMSSGGVSVSAGSQQQQQQQNLDSELHIGPPAPQQQVYHMPISSGADLTMTLSHSSPSSLGSTSGRTMLNLGGVATTTNGTYMLAEHHLQQQHHQHHGYYQASPTSATHHTAPHSLPPSPPNSQPGSPDGQAELLSLAPHAPPPYQQRLGGIKVTGLSPHALLMTHGQGVLTGPKYNRRNNPELEKRRIHFCDYPGTIKDESLSIQ